MAIGKSANLKHLLLDLLRDDNLTKKAFLNGLTSILEYAAKLIVVFIIQPWLVSGLGDYFYGTWQILLRFIGYITPVSGRPAQALRYTLANELNSDDFTQKKQYVGRAIAVWLIFLPILTILGSLLAWFIPYWIKIPTEYIWIVRLTAGILVINLILHNLAAIPQSVLQGENLGYKRMGVSTLLVFTGGGLTWLAVYLNTGIVGVAGATLLTTVITGLFFLQVVRTYSHWFGAARSSLVEIWDFFRISGWFLLWNMINNFMMASDVVILGMLNSVQLVTNYSLTKYAPEALIGSMAIITFGIAPGMGGSIGSGNIQKASKVRNEIMAISWLLTIALGSTLVIWNQAFISLWVGENYFPGVLPNALIVLVVMQFVLIRNDSNFIDLTLNLQRKVILGAISLAVSIVAAVVLVGYFGLGIIGVSLGFLLGRGILSFGYPTIVGQYLGTPLQYQLINSARPAFLTVIFLISAAVLADQVSSFRWFGVEGWIFFLLSVSITFLLSLSLAFYFGLSKQQRRTIIIRIKMVLSHEKKH
jgi:O-antigen/teichoic acid export membrane protein